jgi:prolipoprotein diacylglyceryl transferase
VTGLSLLPLSIPSPPDDWQIPIKIPIGQWLHGLIPAVGENQVIAIHTYAVCILVGIIAATIWVNQRLKARGAEPGIVLDVIIWAVPLGLVGARAYHVLTHLGDYFAPGGNPWNPLEPGSVWAIWEGGNAIFGSIIGGAIGAWIGCRIVGLRFWTFADALAPAMLLAQATGRLGNYFNHELFGQPTDLPWGLEIPRPNDAIPVGLPTDTLFHPTFLYEILWNLAGIAILLFLERKWRLAQREFFGVTVPLFPVAGTRRLEWGKVWALYMIWYGVGRAWFESIRVDPSEVLFGLRANVWGAIVAVIVGIVLYIVQSRRHPGVEPSPYVPGREWTPEGAVDSGETYSDSDEPDDDVLDNSGKLATSGSGTKSSQRD